MSFCVFDNDNPFGDIVAIEGEFVRTFLKSTPSDYVKLYLFCQFALNNDVRCSSVAELASLCNLSVDTVISGLEYFSKEELIRVVSQSPLALQMRSVNDAALKKKSQLPEIMTGLSDYFAALRSITGKDLKPSEMEKAREWLDIYRLPQPVVIMMVQHCLQQLNKSGKKSRSQFAYFDKTAGSWAENGIFTVEDAEYYISTYELEHHVVNDVMLHIGIRRMPSVEEVKLYEKWTKQWGMSHEEVIAACTETTKVANPSFGYLDKIIEGLYSNGITGGSIGEIMDQRRAERERANKLLRTMGLSDQVTQEFMDIVQTAKLAGFDDEGLFYIARNLAKRVYKSVGSFEKELAIWKERSATTADKMQEYDEKASSKDDDIKKLYSVMGIEGQVSKNDRKIYKSLLEKGFKAEAILDAAKDCMNMTALKIKLVPNAKRTNAHDYNSRTDGVENIYTALDELEDN